VALLLAALALPLGMLYVLAPGLPDALALPVAVYAGAIALMAYTAAARDATSDASWRYAAAGALVFVVSDSILAVDKFRSPFPAAKLAVMATYYGAQLLIAASALTPAQGASAEPAARAAPAPAAAASGNKGKGAAKPHNN
jgi:uncharacterized membrane protein YhhN